MLDASLLTFAGCLRAAVSGFFVSVFLACWYVYAFASSSGDVFWAGKLILLTFFLTVVPVVTARYHAQRFHLEQPLSAFWTVAALTLLCVLGLFQRIVEFPVLTVVAACDAMCLFLSLKSIRAASALLLSKLSTPYVVCLLFLGVYISLCAWNPTANPGDALAAAKNGSSHIDLLFHAGTCAMIQTYGIPSGGLHGVSFHAYHWGSHWIVAQLAELTGTGCLEGFSVLVPVVFASLFVFTALMLIARIRDWCIGSATNTSGYDIIFVLAAFSGGLPTPLLDTGASWAANVLFSQSYLLSMVVLLAVFCMCFEVASSRSTLLERGFIYISIPLAFVACGMLKVSTAFIMGAVLSAAVVLNGWWRRSAVLVAYALLPAALLVLSRFAMHRGGEMILSPFDFVSRHTAGFIPYVVFHFFWAWILLGWTLIARHAVEKLQARRLTFLTLSTLSAAFSGAGVANALYILDGSGFYFSDPQRILAIVVLAATLSPRSPKAQRLARFASALILCSTVWNIVLLQFEATAFHKFAEEQTTIRNQERNTETVVSRLLELRSLPREVKQKSCVWIPEDVSFFWLGYYWRRYAAPYIIPAVSQIAAVRGAPYQFAGEIPGKFRGYTLKPYLDLALSPAPNKSIILHEASELGCQRVYHLRPETLTWDVLFETTHG